jgi:5-methylcytosine-specific restriction enzyme B
MPEGSGLDSDFARLAKTMQREHVMQAIAEIDRSSIPSDARSTTYDLIHGARRYPPKYVFSLAAKYAGDREFPRTRFSGGDASQCFKILRNLGFSIERKDFIPTLLKTFIRQADQETDLSVAEYPKAYRGLTVNVSFGKGNRARIPWISFTAFNQTTSNGIYPVVLYYRDENLIVVAYGISETQEPLSKWNFHEHKENISEYFAVNDLGKPPRYGSSYVHTVFEGPAKTNYVELQNSLDKIIAEYLLQFEDSDTPSPFEFEDTKPDFKPYSVQEALQGLFIDESQFIDMLSYWRNKKNIILQGPPGVGKTFVCKRLAFALMEEEAPRRLQVVQFHQTYSYEDFIQGYRPSTHGLGLKNSVFYRFCNQARDDPAYRYVFVIDEINRGNLSKIFGDTMMLIENDKRGPDWAIPLTYSEESEETFYVPKNVFLIGLMNTADRSLAMVDYALRRRFGFFDLEPRFNSQQFREYLKGKGAEATLIEDIVTRMNTLNNHIASNAHLGAGYRIGHSFFCDLPTGTVPNQVWYKRVIDKEIGPLLREYYFDDLSRAAALVDELSQGD